MAICEISNGILTVGVDSRGAELKSLRKADAGTEYMWGADPEYWGRTSPILFPFIGGLRDGEYRTGGKTYKMGKHGFARDKEFLILSQESDELWFVLEADEETKRNYPFEFRLEIGYRLEGKTLKVMWRVENPSKDALYFSIGGHPGFKCPLNKGERRSRYSLLFDEKECIRSTVIGADGLTSDSKIIYELEEGKLPITTELFDRDTMVLEDGQVHRISLVSPDGTSYITVDFDTPVVAVWSKMGVEAPFICIEPWCGLCDNTGFTGTLEERKWGNRIEPGKRFSAGFDITVEE